MALIVDIADELVDALNAAEFTLEFEATRGYVPSFEFADMETIHLTVIPKGLTKLRVTRADSQEDYKVDVAVQQKVEAVDAANLDPLMSLVEELADFCDALVAETTPRAVCITVENEPIYVSEHMRERRMFTSLLTLTFRTWR